MKILLTGACGLVGRAIRRVGAAEHEFVLLDVVEQVEAEGGHRGTVTDRDLIMRLAEGCDAIIHTAAMHGSSFGKESHEAFIKTNVIGADHLCAAAEKHGFKRLVISSSMEALIGRDSKAYGTALLDEALPTRPDWIYPVTKVMVEHLSVFYANHRGLEVINLRYMTVGSDLARHGKRLIGDIIFDDDVARANLLSATKPGLRDQILNIGPDTPLTQKDLNDAQTDPETVVERYYPGAMAVLKKANVTIERRIFDGVTRIDRAVHILGWQPQVTFETYLDSLGWRRMG